jgi:hypothetical protein
MVSVRDAIARLTGDVAALAARISETREFAQRLADRPAPEPAPPPIEAPPEVTARLDGMENTIGVLATSVGELSQRLARIADAISKAPPPTVEAPDLTPLVHVTVPEAIRGAVPAVLRDVIPDVVREAVPEAVRSAVEAHLARLAGGSAEERAEASAAMTDAMVNLRVELDRALSSTWSEVRAAFASSVDRISSSSARAIEDLGSRLDEIARGNDSLSTSLSGDLASLGESLRSIADLPSAVTAMSSAIDALRTAAPKGDDAATIEKALAEGRTAVLDAINAVAADVRREAADTVERVRSETSLALERSGSLADAAKERVGEAGALALGRIGEVSAEIFGRLDGVATTIEREMTKVPRVVADVAARMDEFQEAMLAYLAARDLALEEARDRVLEELLEEYATGLTKRQRKRVGADLRRAFARRKDRRDAERYRSGPEAEVRMPDVSPDAVARAATVIAERMLAEPASESFAGSAAELARESGLESGLGSPLPKGDEADGVKGSPPEPSKEMSVRPAKVAEPQPQPATSKPQPQRRATPAPAAAAIAKPAKPGAAKTVKTSAKERPKAKPIPSKPARPRKGETSLAARLAADAKRTAERLAADSRARQEAQRRARDAAAAEGASRNETDRG